MTAAPSTPSVLTLLNKYWATPFAHGASVDAVFLALLRAYNEQRRPEEFTAPMEWLEAATGLYRKTIRRVLRDLADCGILSKTGGGKGRGDALSLSFLGSSQKGVNDAPLYGQKGGHKGGVSCPPSHLLYNNTLYSKESYKREERRECNAREKNAPLQTPNYEVPRPPTLDEVRRVFLAERANERLPDWELSAERFFNYYDARAWQDSRGAALRYQPLARNWIIKDVNDLKKQTRYAPHQSNHADERARRRADLADYVAAKLGQVPGNALH